MYATRHMTRAAAAAAAAQVMSLPAPCTLAPNMGTSQDRQQDAQADAPKEEASDSDEAEPSSNGTGPESFVGHHEQQSIDHEVSAEIEGTQLAEREEDCRSESGDFHHEQNSPEQQTAVQDAAGTMSQTAPGWRRLEARMEGVLPIWSIFKRFGRRTQTE